MHIIFKSLQYRLLPAHISLKHVVFNFFWNKNNMLQLELYVWILMELPPAKKWIFVELLYFLQVLHLKSVEFIWFTGPMISLHIRSMWETICDAWACWSGWKFGPNSTVYPYSAIQNTPPPKMKIVTNLSTLTFQLQNTPPPPKMKNCQKSWHFNFSVAEYPPPLKFRRFLVLCDFSVVEYPPWKMRIVRNLGTLSFQLQNTPPPPWKLSEMLALWLFSCRLPPPPTTWKIHI